MKFPKLICWTFCPHALWVITHSDQDVLETLYILIHYIRVTRRCCSHCTTEILVRVSQTGFDRSEIRAYHTEALVWYQIRFMRIIDSCWHPHIPIFPQSLVCRCMPACKHERWITSYKTQQLSLSSQLPCSAGAPSSPLKKSTFS